MKIINPYNIVEVKDTLIFLAGPITNAPDWQSDAMNFLSKSKKNIYVASPRRNLKEPDDLIKQVEWETYYLNKAAEKGVILFWLAKPSKLDSSRCYGQTTRYEIGEWIKSNKIFGTKIVLGIEKGFGNESYIEYRVKKETKIKINYDLKTTCKEALSLIG
ncbi:hypothetical protein J4471_01840 [Candidatus Woesearchaeota archaeon]|nr:hypothetical protein [Candidatus Woesearchaeota archaeon]